MVWFVEFEVYEVTHTVEVFEVPPDFFEWVDAQGRFHHPQKAVLYFLGKKFPLESYVGMDIESGRIFEDIRYKMAEAFYGRCLEEHKGLVVKAQVEKEKEKEDKKVRAERILERTRMEKEAWNQKCAADRRYRCEECHENLYRDQTDYIRRGGDRSLIRLCWICARKNITRDGKMVRCSKDGCENPICRNQYTTIPFKLCTVCHQSRS